MALYSGVIASLYRMKPRCSVVFIDSIIQKDLQHKSLRTLGFAKTSYRYFDERYNVDSIVFVAPTETLRNRLRSLKAALKS